MKLKTTSAYLFAYSLFNGDINKNFRFSQKRLSVHKFEHNIKHA
jgi:hypothetical protein